MAITYEAIPASEYISHVDMEQAANQNLYGVISGCTVTESASTMIVTVAAGIALVNGVQVTVAGNTVTLVSNPSNKRWNYVAINASGTAVAVLGDPAASSSVEPTKPDPAGTTILKMYKVEASQTVAANIAVKPSKRIIVPNSDPFVSLADAFGSGGWKALGVFGGGQPAAITGAQLTTATLAALPVGIGFAVELSGAAAQMTRYTLASAGAAAMTTLETGATSGVRATISMSTYDFVPATGYADMRATINLTNDTTRTIFFGIKASDNATDENMLVGFRVTDNGNLIGVCDNAGTETTRDSGFAGSANPGTAYRLRITMSAGTVRFYVNDAQVGADVTTNLPTWTVGNSSFVVLGILNSSAATRLLGFRDVFVRIK